MYVTQVNEKSARDTIAELLFDGEPLVCDLVASSCSGSTLSTQDSSATRSNTLRERWEHVMYDGMRMSTTSRVEKRSEGTGDMPEDVFAAAGDQNAQLCPHEVYVLRLGRELHLRMCMQRALFNHNNSNVLVRLLTCHARHEAGSRRHEAGSEAYA